MIETVSGARFEGAIQAFPGVRGAITHRRVIERTTKGDVCSIRVDDEITGRGQNQLCSRLLFHPDVVIESEIPGAWRLIRNGRTIAKLLIEKELPVEWQTAPDRRPDGCNSNGDSPERGASCAARLRMMLLVDGARNTNGAIAPVMPHFSPRPQISGLGCDT